MKVLIINLTRMGDLIQTTGLVSAVHRCFPDAQIDMLVMSAFSPIVKHMTDIHETFCINDQILNETIVDDMWTASIELWNTIATLNEVGYDIIYNPIVSQQSALLSYLINAKTKLGLQITPTREQKMTSDFIAYQLANQHNLGDYSFNLVDIFAGMVSDGKQLFLPTFDDFKLNVYEDDIGQIDGFRDKLAKAGRKVIGFHIGASQSNKAWDIKLYHRVLEQLISDDEQTIVLFGGYKETDFKSYFYDIRGDCFFNTIGDFKLSELIAAISLVDLFVTNDTGPMHIASALHIPVVDISLGPVSKWETGAYNQNAVIIEARLDCHPCSFTAECHDWKCQYLITPEVVVSVIKSMILSMKNGQKFSTPNALSQGSLPDHRLFTVEKDLFGFLTFRPCYRETITEREYIFHLKRYIWSLFFTGQLSEQVDMSPLLANLKKDYIFDNLDISTHITILESLEKLVSIIIAELSVVCSTLQSPENIAHSLRNIKTNKELLFDFAQHIPEIYDWFWFLLFSESQIEDEDIATIGQKTKIAYEILHRKLRIINAGICLSLY